MICKNILISLLFLSAIYAQNTIEGYVLNSDNNEPIQNVNVLLLNTVEGAASNSDGYFKIITNLTFPLTISVSHVGFEKKEIELSGSELLIIKLTPIVLPGEEVSVKGIYSRSDQDISASIESLNLEEMESIGASDVSDALATISSVNMIQAEGGVQTVSIRGGNSDEVAVYLDGIKLNDANTGVANLAAIDQRDISAINVIKGGNTTLYGAGSFGGVLNMTTKMPDSTDFSLNRGFGMIDDENVDFGIAGSGRIGIFGLGGRYSGKSRRYYGRSLYSTIFKNASLVIYPKESALVIKVFELQDYLKLPSDEVLQDASTKMGMVRYNGNIFNSSNWEFFYGMKKWQWEDDYYTNLNRKLDDATITARAAKSILLNNFDSIIQLEYETQDYSADNHYTYDTLYSYNDIGNLSRSFTNLSIVSHWKNPINHPILKQLRWEIGYRLDMVNTEHQQEFELLESTESVDLPTNIDTTISNNLSNLKFGASIFGETENSQIKIYINQGNSKRLPTLNDLVLWKGYITENEKPELLTETQATTEIGFELNNTGLSNLPAISKATLSGSLFISNYNNKIAYQEDENSLLFPFNTDLSRIFGYDIEIGFDLFNDYLGIGFSRQYLNIDDPIIFPNKPKHRTIFHASVNYRFLTLAYNHYWEGEQYVLYSGIVGTSLDKQETANLSATLKFNIWKAKLFINYVIHNLYSEESALADPEYYYLNPYSFFDVHREILTVRIEL